MHLQSRRSARLLHTFCQGQKGGNLKGLKGEEEEDGRFDELTQLKYEVDVEIESAMALFFAD